MLHSNVKEAKQVINARPTELLIKQHLPDPIQQRELELVMVSHFLVAELC